MKRLLALTVGSLLLMGCESLLDPFGKNIEPILPGKRLIVLTEDNRIAVNPVLASTQYRAPAPQSHRNWPVLRQNGQHFLQNLAWNGHWAKRWSAPLVGALSAEKPIQAPVIIANDTVFGMNHRYGIRAVSLNDGKPLWSFDDATDIKFSNAYGGGIAFGKGKIILATGYGDVVGIEALTGQEAWRVSLGIPIRGAPSIFQNQAVVQTLNSQAVAFDITDGAELWFHAGADEMTSIINRTSAASDDTRVFLAYPSGEVAAFDPDYDDHIWLDTLNSALRTSELDQISTIATSPILINDALLVAGYGDQLVLFNASTGQRIWEQPVGTLKLPWIAKTLIFLLDKSNRLYAFDLFSGNLRWRINPDQTLHQWQRAQAESEVISEKSEPDEILADDFRQYSWTAPVMLNSELVLLNTEGTLMHLAPDSGEVREVRTLDHGSTLPIQVVADTLLVTDTSGAVHAYR